MAERKLLIDLSYHNDPNDDIDFNAIRNETEIDGVILREGYRQTIDKKFLKFVEECKKYGLRIYGVYHFLYPLNAQQAIEEAISCVNNIKKAGINPSSIIVFADYEYDTIKNAQKNGVLLTKNDCNVFTEAFCAGITNLGYHAGIYTNIDFYKNYYIDVVKNKYPIWLADYSGDPDFACIIQQFTNKGKVIGIRGDVDLNWLYESVLDQGGTEESTPDQIPQSLQVVELAQSWVGKNEKDGSYKEIIDIYNSFAKIGPLPRNIKMQYEWAWCACTWSALAIKLGLTDVMPIEISCGELVNRAKEMRCWIEDDHYVPSPGDAILYDWQDKKSDTDNVGWPDHVGVVEYVCKDAGYFTVIEGNYDDSVKKRTVMINGRYIRGFIHPNYKGITTIVPNPVQPQPNKSTGDIAHEVIAGLWGSGDKRKELLTAAGYNYDIIQAGVNACLNRVPNTPGASNTDPTQPINQRCFASSTPDKWDFEKRGTYVTDCNLYLRNGAGTNKKAMCIIPEKTMVQTNGHYTMFGDTPWLYVNFIMNATHYAGFASSTRLSKLD